MNLTHLIDVKYVVYVVRDRRMLKFRVSFLGSEHLAKRINSFQSCASIQTGQLFCVDKLSFAKQTNNKTYTAIVSFQCGKRMVQLQLNT